MGATPLNPSAAVFVDEHGTIRGAVVFGEPQRGEDEVRHSPASSQDLTVHEVDLPPELRGRDLAPDAFEAYQVVVEGGNATLRRREG
ncbi:hypothetical protein [Streptomyces sp. NBC_00158]|uniref:hypothetical protein n=1 Tax=Streptomyces sp. NBC_00158 TaxID=2903627 RepID=UPI00324C9F49